MFFLSIKGEMVINFSNSKVIQIIENLETTKRKKNENCPSPYHLEITSADPQ